MSQDSRFGRDTFAVAAPFYDRYRPPYQARRCEPALANRMSGSGGTTMRSRGALAVCGLAAQ